MLDKVDFAGGRDKAELEYTEGCLFGMHHVVVGHHREGLSLGDCEEMGSRGRMGCSIHPGPSYPLP